MHEADDLVGVRIDELAQLVADAYRDRGRIERGVRQSAADTGFGLPASVPQTVARRAAARIPMPGLAANPHFDTPRAELGEILVSHCLEQHHGVVFPAKRLRHKERVDLPMRGVDNLGLTRDGDTGELGAVVVEVKSSTDASSPPKVVEGGGDSIAQQLTGRLKRANEIYEALNWAEEHCLPGREELALEALAAFEAGQLSLIASPGLVRQANHCQDRDFGRYATEDVHPGHRVLFNLIRIDGDLRIVVHDAYAGAKRLAQ